MREFQTVGKMIQVKILSLENDGPVERGEICVKRPTMMLGYVNASMEGVFDQEGFFRTGDIGFLDGDGNLHYTDRLKVGLGKGFYCVVYHALAPRSAPKKNLDDLGPPIILRIFFSQNLLI